MVGCICFVFCIFCLFCLLFLRFLLLFLLLFLAVVGVGVFFACVLCESRPHKTVEEGSDAYADMVALHLPTRDASSAGELPLMPKRASNSAIFSSKVI